MSETMILPINTSPPPIQAARPAETGVSTGPSFDDILRAQTETPEPKQAAPARPAQKETARTTSTEEAKANPPAEDQPVEQPKDTQTKPVEDPAAQAALAAAQQVVQPAQIQILTVEPAAAPTADAPVDLVVEAAPQQVATLPEQAPTQSGQQVQPTDPAAASFIEQLQAAETNTAKPVEQVPAQTEAQPVQAESTEPKHEQLKVDVKPAEAKPEPEPQVKLETAPAAEPKVEAKPVATAHTPAASKEQVETVKGTATGKAETSAAGEQEAPKQVQAPPGSGHAEVTGLEVKTTAATPQFTEPARLAEAQTSDMIGQITRQMDQLSQSGRTTLRMQLYPNELGQIDLKITTTPQGVGITILADSANTGKLLETQVAQLRQSLMDAGVQITNLQVGAQNAGQQQSFGSQNSTPRSQYGAYRGGSESSETESIREVRSRDSLVDYSV